MLYGGCQLARVFQVSGWPGVMPWLLSYTGSTPVASTTFYPRAVSRKHRRSLFIKLKPKEVNHDQDENDQRKVAGTDLDR